MTAFTGSETLNQIVTTTKGTQYKCVDATNKVFELVGGSSGSTLILPASFSSSAVQNLPNSVLTTISCGSGNYSGVGVMLNGVFTFSRAGLYMITVDTTLIINTIGSNNISGRVIAHRNGSPAAGGAPRDTNYVVSTGSYGFNISACVPISVAVNDTVHAAAIVTADSNFTSASCNSYGLAIFPVT